MDWDEARRNWSILFVVLAVIACAVTVYFVIEFDIQYRSMRRLDRIKIEELEENSGDWWDEAVETCYMPGCDQPATKTFEYEVFEDYKSQIANEANLKIVHKDSNTYSDTVKTGKEDVLVIQDYGGGTYGVSKHTVDKPDAEVIVDVGPSIHYTGIYCDQHVQEGLDCLKREVGQERADYYGFWYKWSWGLMPYNYLLIFAAAAVLMALFHTLFYAAEDSESYSHVERFKSDAKWVSAEDIERAYARALSDMKWKYDYNVLCDIILPMLTVLAILLIPSLIAEGGGRNFAMFVAGIGIFSFVRPIRFGITALLDIKPRIQLRNARKQLLRK